MKIEIRKIPYKIENKSVYVTELFIEIGEKLLTLPIDTNLINDEEILSRVKDFVSQFETEISISSNNSKG